MLLTDQHDDTDEDEIEPLLVRPYVRYLALAPLPHPDAFFDVAPAACLTRPDRHGHQRLTPGDPARPVPALAGPADHRERRRYHATGWGVLALAVTITALVLGAGDRPTLPAADTVAVTAPKGGHLSEVPAQVAPIQPLIRPDRSGPITGAAGLCLDGGAAGGVRLQHCAPASGQRWTMAHDGTVRALGRCLEPAGGQARLHDCDGGPAQVWRPGLGGSLVNAASRQCLGAPYEHPDAGTSQRVGACRQTAAQRWTLP